MQRPPSSPDLSTFLERDVLPALFERLDQAFPEFGWKRRPRGDWQATDREFTKAQFGARPERIVASYPFGFKVHGGDFTTWTTYLNQGTSPRGEQFPRVLRDLASRAGVPFPERTWTPAQRQAAEEASRRRTLLEDFWEVARAELHGEAGQAARDYLVARDFSPGNIEELPLGLYPKPGKLRAELERRYSREAVDASGLLKDKRWEGRLVGCWRDRFGSITTFWARALDEENGPKYLYLDGSPRRGLFGLDVALRSPEGRDDLVLVEGVLDVLQLQARGFPNVAALGGTDTQAETFQALAPNGPRRITLALDNDDAGRKATLRSVHNLRKVDLVRNVYVLDVADLADHKDPDAYVRGEGIDAFRELVARAPHAYRFLAQDILDRHRPSEGWTSSDKARDAALREGLEIYEEETSPAADESLDRYLIRPIVQQTGAGSLAWIMEDLAKKAEQRRQDDLRKEREDRARKTLGSHLRGALEDLDQAPPRDLSKRLLTELAQVQLEGGELPPSFSVERLDAESAQVPIGKPSGWSTLDELDVTFNPGELAVLGARTGHGKTSVLTGLLLNWLHAERDEPRNEVLLLYSSEEPEVRIYHRLLALIAAHTDAESPWTTNRIRDYLRGSEPGDRWTETDLLQEAKDSLREMEKSLVVVYRPSWTIDDIVADAHARAHQRPVGGLLVDYLQRVPPPRGSFDRRDLEVSAIARQLKALAVDLQTPVVAGAQINREAARLSTVPAGNYTDSEVRQALRRRRPQLHHLREGGSEQEADLVLGLMNYRADFEEDTREASSVPAVTLLEVGTLKNRYGTPGRWASLAFAGRLGLIRDPWRNEDL